MNPNDEEELSHTAFYHAKKKGFGDDTAELIAIEVAKDRKSFWPIRIWNTYIKPALWKILAVFGSLGLTALGILHDKLEHWIGVLLQ